MSAQRRNRKRSRGGGQGGQQQGQGQGGGQAQKLQGADLWRPVPPVELPEPITPAAAIPSPQIRRTTPVSRSHTAHVCGPIVAFRAAHAARKSTTG